MLKAGRLMGELRKEETWKPDLRLWQWDHMGMRVEKCLEGRNYWELGSEQISPSEGSRQGSSRVTPELLVGASGSMMMP